jgi:hypothetical protein
MKKKILFLLSFVIFVPALTLASGESLSSTTWSTQGEYEGITINCGVDPDTDAKVWSWYDDRNTSTPIDNTDQPCNTYEYDFLLSNFFSWTDFGTLTEAGPISGYVIWHSSSHSCSNQTMEQCMEEAEYGSIPFSGVSPL